MTCSCTLQTAQFVAHSFQDLYQKSLQCHPDLQDCLVQFLNEQVLLTICNQIIFMLNVLLKGFIGNT